MTFPVKNLELKVPVADLQEAHTCVLQLGARFDSSEFQTDTYFLVPNGRLKLRETFGKPAFLIAYHRPCTPEAHESNYVIVPVEQPDELKKMLRMILGVRGVVCKQRNVFLWKNVRIHLDTVTDLGTFVELEAVLSSREEEDSAAVDLQHLCQELHFDSAHFLPGSYADLLNL